jgi:hypothetical protein
MEAFVADNIIVGTVEVRWLEPQHPMGRVRFRQGVRRWKRGAGRQRQGRRGSQGRGAGWGYPAEEVGLTAVKRRLGCTCASRRTVQGHVRDK